MSDHTIKYKGFVIAKNQIGYRVCFLSYSPIFGSLKATKAWISTLPKELAFSAPCQCARCK